MNSFHHGKKDAFALHNDNFIFLNRFYIKGATLFVKKSHLSHRIKNDII